LAFDGGAGWPQAALARPDFAGLTVQDQLAWIAARANARISGDG
jgi:hypothetical protein